MRQWVQNGLEKQMALTCFGFVHDGFSRIKVTFITAKEKQPKKGEKQ